MISDAPSDAIVINVPKRGNPNPGLARKKFASAKKAFKEALTTEDLVKCLEVVKRFALHIDPETKEPVCEPKDSIRAIEFIFDRLCGKGQIKIEVNAEKVSIDFENIDSLKRDYFRRSQVARLEVSGRNGSSESVHSEDSNDPAG